MNSMTLLLGRLQVLNLKKLNNISYVFIHCTIMVKNGIYIYQIMETQRHTSSP